jgi:hypothetical protein
MSDYSLFDFGRKWIINGMPMSKNKTINNVIDNNTYLVGACANNLIHKDKYYR